jgi:hypothetical protein
VGLLKAQTGFAAIPLGTEVEVVVGFAFFVLAVLAGIASNWPLSSAIFNDEDMIAAIQKNWDDPADNIPQAVWLRRALNVDQAMKENDVRARRDRVGMAFQILDLYQPGDWGGDPISEPTRARVLGKQPVTRAPITTPERGAASRGRQRRGTIRRALESARDGSAKLLQSGREHRPCASDLARLTLTTRSYSSVLGRNDLSFPVGRVP